MKRVLSVVVVAAHVLTAIPLAAQQGQIGVATGEGPLARAAVREAVVLALAAPSQQSESVVVLRDTASRIPVGKKVKAKTVSGTTVEGKLRTAGDTSVVIESSVSGRVELAYEQMRSLEQRHGLGTGTWVLIGIGVGLAVFVGSMYAWAQ